MKNTISVYELSGAELTEVNGGSFAYDLGWAIRFGWQSFGGIDNAILDAYINYKPLN